MTIAGTIARTAMKSAPGSVMRLSVFGEVALGLGPGPDAGDEPALLAQVVGLLDRVEGDRRVEVREADDQQAEADEVERVRRARKTSLMNSVTDLPPSRSTAAPGSAAPAG